MKWAIALGQVCGDSHVASGRPCEDAATILEKTAPNGDPLIFAAVCDGAGSVEQGGLGAKTAVEAAAARFSELATKDDFVLDEIVGWEILSAARHALEDKAAEMAIHLRELSCTFLALICSPDRTISVQIGDGGIVFHNENQQEEAWTVATIPMTGEYANSTHFLTTDKLGEICETKFFDGCPKQFAVFSDGLQSVALNLKTGAPHAPFFKPLFLVVDQNFNADKTVLNQALDAYLMTEAIRERSDDDKTLILCSVVDENEPEQLV